jgi:hypothetical protein
VNWKADDNHRQFSLSISILYQAVTKDTNIVLTEQILQLVVELWKIIVNNFRGAAALMIDSAMKGESKRRIYLPC